MAVSHVNVSALAAHTWSVHDVPHRAHGESGGGDGGGEGEGGEGGGVGQYPQVPSHFSKNTLVLQFLLLSRDVRNLSLQNSGCVSPHGRCTGGGGAGGGGKGDVGGGEGGDVGGGPASVKGTYGDGDGGGGEGDSSDGDRGQYPHVSSHLLLVA